jgi:steroid 5-alpha reductase family enzyme
MTEIASLLSLNFALLILVILALWAYAVRIRDVSFIDAFWAFAMVLLAWSSWLQMDGQSLRAQIALALTTLWGLRLSGHLFTRWRAHGEDPRYAKIMAGFMVSKGWSWPTTALFAVFLMQAPLLFITCLPAQIGIWNSEGAQGIMGPVAWAGAFIAMIGIIFETIGDAQLKSFRANPANMGKVLNHGLWRYTRHPNYFGDACTWWGIWLIAAETGPWGWVSIIGPIFLTFTLTKWSGKPLLERSLKKSRPDYAAYIARTSGFFPWLPKADHGKTPITPP